MTERIARLALRRADDFHLHLRDGDALRSLLSHPRGIADGTVKRAIIMPNLVPPVTTTEHALAYRERIMAALPPGADFQPLMTLYLTDETPPSEIARAKASGAVFAVKLYPAGATTNSDAGVTDIGRCLPTLRAMAEISMPLLVHGEVTDPDTDIFDRERLFLERKLRPVLEAVPTLKVVLEHITTEEAVNFVLSHGGDNVAATITAHHLLYNRNALFEGGVRPHYFCKPILKRERHRRALLRALSSRSPRFFAGTDSAPHEVGAKERDCGCAGVYTSHAALALYAEAMEEAGCLTNELYESFVAGNGARFYGLPLNAGRVVLERRPWKVPRAFPYGGGELRPLRAEEEVAWTATLASRE